MCGFIASFGQNINDYGLKIAFDQLKRRGPDAKGIWTDKEIFLGSRRLAIFDLHERSNQPMKSICESYTTNCGRHSRPQQQPRPQACSGGQPQPQFRVRFYLKN